MDLRHEHLTDRQPKLATALADVITNRRLRDLDAVLIEQPPPDPLRCMPLLARRGQITDQPLMDSSRYSPNLAPADDTGLRFAGGTEDSNACLTARRCTPCLAANARIESPSRSLSRLICSNNSTLEPTS